MTGNSSLREFLHENADQARTYDLYAGALARARRDRRRRRAVAAAVAVLVLALGVILPLGVPRGGTLPAVPPGATPSLPDRVGTPLWGTPGVRDTPPGAAAVVFGAPDWWPLGSKGDLAVVGAYDDTYGLLHHDDMLYAGEQAVLSPDGSRIAVPGAVLDLGTGARVALPALGFDLVVPQAWTPDGRLLAVIAYAAPYARQPDGTEVRETADAVLYLVDPAAGTARQVAFLEPENVHDGYTVAFAPDGDRLAYQSGDAVRVAKLDGTLISEFDVPTGARLAGKGAWTPFGNLALVRQDRCCDGDPYPSSWELTVVDTEGDLEGAVFTELSGLVAVRLLGWSAAGEAIVVALRPDFTAEVAGFDTGAGTPGISHYGLTGYERVTAAEVWAVGPGTAPRTLLSAPGHQMLSVDVADGVLASGLIRTGHPPQGTSPYLRSLLTAVGLTGVALVTGLVLLVRHLHRRRR